MFGSRTLNLLLLALALSTTSTSTAAKSTLMEKIRGIQPVAASSAFAAASGKRGRTLEDEYENDDDYESAERSDDSEDSKDSKESDDSEVSQDIEESSEDGPSTRSSVRAPTIRKCATEQKKGKVEWECKASTEDTVSEIKDKLKFKVGATKGDFLKIDIEYETEIEDIATDMETETETKYTLVYDRIIEYRKVGSAPDGHYEWDVDEIVNTWPMDTWNDLSAVATDGNLLTFSASDGVASFTFTIAQAESVDLTANKMKIDFLLENYPWDASGDTYVALVSHIETERETETEGEDGTDVVEDVMISFNEVVDTRGFIPFGEYSWAKTAEATRSSNATMGEGDGQIQVERSGENITDGFDLSSTTTTINVVASSAPQTQTAEAGTTFQEIAFSFVGAAQGADRIFWDPEAGVGYADDGSSAAGRLFGYVGVVTASVAMLFVF